MREDVKKIYDSLLSRYEALNDIGNDIIAAFDCLQTCATSGHKILLCGNGGSDADCNHFVGELMKGFILPRTLSKDDRIRILYPEIADKLQYGIPAISLNAHSALVSAFSNDVDPVFVYAQQLLGYYRPGDVLIGFSTSGNSENVINAFKVMNALGGKSIAFTGHSGGILSTLADILIAVPATETYKVQELHLPVYHCICMMLEQYIFGLAG